MASDIIFNVLDWHEEDENKIYTIRLFGRTEDNKSVSLKIDGYPPFFYIEIPDYWDKKIVEKFVNKIKTIISLKYSKDSRNGCINHLKDYDIVERFKFRYFTAGKKFKFLRLVFNNMGVMKLFANIFSQKIDCKSFDNSINYKTFQIYESNIDPYLRFMHIRDINACGWIKIPANKYTENIEEISSCHYNIKCKWTDVFKYEKNDLAQFKIASFDIECTSGDGSFPQANREEDRIIQIGTVFSKCGSNEIYKKHIITLGSCDPIEGVEVESYKSEKEVLLAWQRLIQREDPDILTGYNIFFFDEKYMYDRAQLNTINCLDSFSKLSKIGDIICKFVDSKLSSSALGDNILRYIKTIGRIQIDLMKVIQKDHKLTSYKLDSVAEHFIKEPIKSINKIDNNTLEIISTNTSAINVNNYIKIEINGESLNDKFKIISNENNKMIVQSEKEIDDINFTGKLSWGLVKDDIHASDIFRLQKGSASDRKIIAQYCIQDCVLVSKILSKLEILVNNVSMANVCHVPMSYLFLRGQGIKSLSLVSKECRKQQYLIPVIKKNIITEQTEDIEDTGFEGATVFEPEIGFHKTPITVLDFNSLYPSSIIARNVSHETLLDPKDESYNNLENYNYENVEYKASDGSIITCRYAKNISGDYGILPNILQTLLKERKSTKKLMENEEDPFKKTILDGKQLALKITANSLYGQLGASTSPIYLKELAASTTAIGRRMLETAREFVETRLPDILYQLYQYDCQGNDDEFNKLLDQELEDRNNTNFIEMLKTTIHNIFDSHNIRQKYNIEEYDIIQDEYIKILDTKYKKIYRIYSSIPSFLQIGNRIRIQTNDTIHETKYTVLEIKKGFFDIGLKEDDDTCYINLDEEKIYWMLAMVIYGDTDSIFIRMNITDKYTNQLKSDKTGLDWSIKLGQIASKMLKKRLPVPQNMEYEKTFWPFCIMAKKKYVGNKYENDPIKFKQSSMGIVLKRRDNANIVKKIVGGIIDIMMNEMDVKKTIKYVKKSIKDIFDDKYPINDFITTKTLKGSYKVDGKIVIDSMKEYYKEYSEEELINKLIINGYLTKKDNNKFESVSVYINASGEYHIKDISNNKIKLNCNYCPINQTHVMLAHRMRLRDPGNAPQLNDRIPFVSIQKFHQKSEKILQGDKVEHPEYIKNNNLKIDYLFYLTNQIMNPSIQFLELIMENPEEIFNKLIDKEKANIECSLEYIEYLRECDELKKNKIKEDSLIHGDKVKKTMKKWEENKWIKNESKNDDWEPIVPNIESLIQQIKKKPKKSVKKTKSINCS